MVRRVNARRSTSRRALIEAIEGRRLMSVVPVLNTNDSGAGSLRDAIHDAAPGDTIDLTGLTGTIQLITGTLQIQKALTIVGPGADALTIKGESHSPVILNAGPSLSVQGLTITGGESAASGGGIFTAGGLTLNGVTLKDNHAFLYGGGIDGEHADVVLNHCTFLHNTASGALEASGGGLYLSGGSLTVDGCTFSQNMAIGASNTGVNSGPGTGGGIYLNNTLASTITNCTFGDNTAQGGSGTGLSVSGQAFGGAIYTNTTNSTLLNHCTIAYNAATGGGNALLNTLALSQGGGVYSATNTIGVTLQDTIAALNSASNQPDVLNTLVSSLGNNLIGVYSGTLFNHSVLCDLLGNSLQPYAPGISTALSANGGSTMTYAVLDNSPAINAGSTTTSPAFDQRGLGRRNAPDIGAYELDANHLPVIAAPSVQATAGNGYSQAIATADADGDTVTVTSPNLPSFLTLQTVNGVTSLVGNPTELQAGIYKIELDAYDGFQTVATSFKFKVNVVGIDLSDTGLLRVNGSEINDTLSVTMVKGSTDTVRVNRNGFVRNFPLSSIKKIQIFGFEGNDDIYVNVGPGVRASINAGDGNDTVTGGDGNDYISGGLGNDLIHGGGGRDRIDADGGNDTIFGDSGIDTLHGGDGDDFVDGGSGERNRIFGDAGNDVLVSTGLKDVIDGGLGANSGTWSKFTTVFDAVMRNT